MADILEIKSFWENNPVAARRTQEKWGSYDFFRKFDNMREADDCEPYSFSNKIHGYTQSAGKRILDVGCGNGYVLAQYAKNGTEVYGIDLTEQALTLTRRRFEMSNLQGEFKITNGSEIPYPDNYFDIGCCMGVLHHNEDPGILIRELHRVLRPCGEVILMVYNKYSFRNQVIFRLRRYFGQALFRGKSLQTIRNMNDGIGCPLVKVYSKNEMKELLKDYFTDLSFITNKLPYRELFYFPILVAVMRRLLPTQSSEGFFAKRWGMNLYIKGVKR